VTASSTPFVVPRTDEGKVFDQAIDYLYMPLVPAPQRSALFRLLQYGHRTWRRRAHDRQ
jgi:hypothetical protein